MKTVRAVSVGRWLMSANEQEAEIPVHGRRRSRAPDTYVHRRNQVSETPAGDTNTTHERREHNCLLFLFPSNLLPPNGDVALAAPKCPRIAI